MVSLGTHQSCASAEVLHCSLIYRWLLELCRVCTAAVFFPIHTRSCLFHTLCGLVTCLLAGKWMAFSSSGVCAHMCSVCVCVCVCACACVCMRDGASYKVS